MGEETNQKPDIFAIRTTIGQEKSAADMLKSRSESRDLPIKSILVPQDIRGYIFIEADGKGVIERARSGIKHAKGMIKRKIPFKEIEDLLEPKPTVSGIEVGDIVELSAGPFKGERARIIRIDDSKEEATVELFEATVPIPVTVRGDHVRVVERKKESEEE
ncbi:MAG: transcription elongation factor Spt5 [Hadesarchaea archaeon]|nr:transcription elongation factor Spt5 [Hadesarchaea archaeon]